MRELLRDPDLMRDVLRRRLLRGAHSAVSFLVAATRGSVSSVSEEQFRAASLLARLAPQLVGDVKDMPADVFDAPEWWTPEKIICMEILSDADGTREKYADWWGGCFEKTGPHPPHFSTLAEAREYGRHRFDTHQGDDANELREREMRQFSEEYMP